MYKKDVIDHFGTQRAVAKALGISDAAVSQWKEVIPEERRIPIRDRYSWRPEVPRKRLSPSGVSKTLFTNLNRRQRGKSISRRINECA